MEPFQEQVCVFEEIDVTRLVISWSFLTRGTQNSSHMTPFLDMFQQYVILVKSIFTGATPMLPKQICLIRHHGGYYLKSSTKAEVGGAQCRCKGCLDNGVISGVAHLASLCRILRGDFSGE